MRPVERANDGLHAHVAEHLTQRAPDRQARILDVGCGTGALLLRLQGLGYRRLSGVDIDPPKGLHGVELLQCDLDRFKTPWPDRSIDVVVAVEVFEHVENLGSLLQELARLLAPSGLMLITTPNVHSVEARLRHLLTGHLKQFDAIGDPTHVTPIFQFPFRRILERHGLQVVDAWGFPKDGHSPTSRRGLRLLASAMRLLGVRGAPAGDQLCMAIRRRPGAADDDDPDVKRQRVTAHYPPLVTSEAPQQRA